VELGPGTVLLGKYRVDEVLGTGGMGKVLRASHLYLQQSYAIKVLLPQMADSASTVSRFLREAQATVALKSEHIAKVWDVGTMPGSSDTPPTPFIVMEYLDGNDLNQVLRHHGPQTPPVVCELMLQACEGLAEAHAMGIVHRDIKPSNLFITRRSDGTMLLKILDFGISKTPVGVTELTGTQTVLGTPTYMAPEQMKTSKGAEARSDIWSLGVVMYQLITGRPPFSGESYAELVLKVNSDLPAPIMVPLPPGLGEVIMRCLEKDPKDRPQNVGELARQLAPYSSDPISAAQSSARSTRILQQRTAQKGVQGSPLAASGGRATPMPIQPAQLTPRSWPPTSSGSSLSQGKGQVTHKVRSGRGWLIAGVAGLVVLAGAGGFVASRMMTGDAPVAASSAVPPPPVTPEPPAPIAPPPPPPATAETNAAAGVTTPPPAVPALPPPTPTLAPKAEKVEKKPAVEKKQPVEKKVAAKPPVKKPAKKPAKKTKKKADDDDLFDTRK
jgi:serine/threonine protein kinase